MNPQQRSRGRQQRQTRTTAGGEGDPQPRHDEAGSRQRAMAPLLVRQARKSERATSAKAQESRDQAHFEPDLLAKQGGNLSRQVENYTVHAHLD
jgi:hypothetical protein